MGNIAEHRRLTPDEKYKLISDGFDSFSVFIPARAEEVGTHLLKQLIGRDLAIRQSKSLRGTITMIATQLELREDTVVSDLNSVQSHLFKGLSNTSLLSLFGTTDRKAINTYQFFQKLSRYMINLYIENENKLKEIDAMYGVPKSEKVLDCLKFIGIQEVSAIEKYLVSFHVSNSRPFVYVEHTAEAVKLALDITQLDFLIKQLQKSVFKQLDRKKMKSIFGKYTKFRMNDEKFLKKLCEEVCKHMW